MSGAQTSTFSNVLYDPLMASRQTYAENQLLTQQQDISGHEIEMGARLASTLLDSSLYPTTEARAAAYPGLVARARAQFPGYFSKAPDTYPGDQATMSLARLGTPSADLYRLGIDRQAKGAIAPSDGTATTAGTGGGGGGGGASGGLTGDLETDRKIIAKRESGGDPTALNYVAKADPTAYARGATASGKYQFVNSTWREGMQLAGLDPSKYATAKDAPEAVQDQVFTAVYGKYGNAPWKKGPRDWVKDEQGRYQLATVRPAAGAPGGAPSVTAPGAPTAPATPPGVTMGQVGDKTAPPPPRGAPGGYPAYGGGMGAVIGGQPAAVSGTPIPAGRPTGPPVITDQPAGSNVVAGPPGVATVGVPQPPSPEVPGNVAAISRGIVGAGGQPVTDPNLTPTPARYAGTAPAPSVEAPPQPGWGTGVGSGYGPQNALAPTPVPAAPARPAAPAVVQPSAAQPPAADTLPPLPPPAPPERRNNNGLTTAQQHDIDNQRNTSISAKDLQAKVDAYRTANDARAEKFQADQLAYAREARERQSSAQAQQDRAQAQQLAREAAQRDAERLRIAQAAAQAARAKEDREAVEANKPFHGNTPDAQNRNILIEGTNSGKTDTTEYQSAYADYATEKVDANGLRYRPDMRPYATPTGKVYGTGEGGRELGKADVGSGQVAPTPATTAMLGISHSQRLVMRALENLNKYPGGVGIMKGSQPNIMSNWTDPEGVNLRADIGELKAYKYHDLSGSAVTVYEEPRLQRFTPQETDTAEALRTKLTRSLDVNRQTLLDHYRTYGPEAGFRRMPNVEEEILATIPQTALDHLKENPKLAKEFDKQFGRGAAKVALQNG